MWNLPAPPGFQGLRENLPLTLYDQLLPHWRQTGATYFVTFRLHDSLPQSKLRELRSIKAEWERRHPPPRSAAIQDDLSRNLVRRIETWLDQGMGSCCLRSPEVSKVVINAMHAADDTRCELGCYVVMPNHVHAVVRPLHSTADDLELILRSWKGATAREINLLLGRSGALWQRESFDRILRDEEHLWRAIQYVGANASRAGLMPDVVPRWIRPSWVACGWNFDTS